MNETCVAGATTQRLPHPLEIVRGTSHLDSELLKECNPDSGARCPERVRDRGQWKTAARQVISVKGCIARIRGAPRQDYAPHSGRFARARCSSNRGRKPPCRRCARRSVPCAKAFEGGGKTTPPLCAFKRARAKIRTGRSLGRSCRSRAGAPKSDRRPLCPSRNSSSSRACRGRYRDKDC